MTPRRSSGSAAARRKEDPGTPARTSARSACVVLDLEMADGRAHLLLANCGDAVATDVRVTFSRPLVGVGGRIVLSDLPLFAHLGVLRPGKVLRVFWDSSPVLLAGREAQPFEATVRWTEPGVARRVQRRATYRHDPAIFRVWPSSA